VKRAVFELTSRQRTHVDTSGSVEAWIRESHELAKSFVYSPLILQATSQPGQLAKVQLPADYLQGAGEHARRRVFMAGVRLGAVIKQLPVTPADARRLAETSKPAAKPATDTPAATRPPAETPVSSFAGGTPSAPAASSGDSKALTHWLNLNGDVRHNSTCRNFKNTKNGRMCTASEGRPCGLCGG
jgi:hypothetical protein